MSKFKPSRTAAAVIGNSAATSRRPPARQTTAAVQDVPGAAGGVQPAAVADPVFQERVLNPTRQFALKCTLLFLFFRFSFLHEFISAKVHFDTHILVVLGAASYFACFLAGDFLTAFKERAAWMWCGLGACMILATAFSTWRGGSFGVVLPYLKTTLPLVFLIPAVAYTADDLKKVVNTIGVAGMVTILIGFASSDFKSGRMALGSPGSDIADSNDYAAHMILVLPAIAYLFFAPKRSIIFKAFGALVICGAMYQILSTGSRGGLVGLLITCLYILKKGSSKVRLAILVGLPTLALLAFPLIPHDSAARLKSLFGQDEDTHAADVATESREARKALFWASVHITLHHPLFGIGPGEFMDVQAGIAKDQGERGMWHETHNAYTQLSSECGIPALFFYLAALSMTYLILLRVIKAGLPVTSTLASILSVMLVGYSVCIIFLSHGYNFSMPALSGITIALGRLTANQSEAREESSASPAPAMSRQL